MHVGTFWNTYWVGHCECSISGPSPHKTHGLTQRTKYEQAVHHKMYKVGDKHGWGGCGGRKHVRKQKKIHMHIRNRGQSISSRIWIKFQLDWTYSLFRRHSVFPFFFFSSTLAHLLLKPQALIWFPANNLEIMICYLPNMTICYWFCLYGSSADNLERKWCVSPLFSDNGLRDFIHRGSRALAFLTDAENGKTGIQNWTNLSNSFSSRGFLPIFAPSLPPSPLLPLSKRKKLGKYVCAGAESDRLKMLLSKNAGVHMLEGHSAPWR